MNNKEIDNLAKQLMIDDGSLTNLIKKYGQGASAEQNDFGFKFAQICATLAYESVERNSYNLINAAKKLSNAIYLLNDDHFFFGLDSFKKKLMENSELTIDGKLKKETEENLSMYMLQNIEEDSSKCKFFEKVLPTYEKKSALEDYVELSQIKTDPKLIAGLTKDFAEIDKLAQTFMLENKGDTKALKSKYNGGVSASDDAFGWQFTTICVAHAVDMVSENPENLREASTRLGKAIDNLTDVHFAFAIDHFKNKLTQAVPYLTEDKAKELYKAPKIELTDQSKEVIAHAISKEFKDKNRRNILIMVITDYDKISIDDKNSTPEYKGKRLR